jgi:hypothetical protein
MTLGNVFQARSFQPPRQGVQRPWGKSPSETPVTALAPPVAPAGVTPPAPPVFGPGDQYLGSAMSQGGPTWQPTQTRAQPFEQALFLAEEAPVAPLWIGQPPVGPLEFRVAPNPWQSAAVDVVDGLNAIFPKPVNTSADNLQSMWTEFKQWVVDTFFEEVQDPQLPNLEKLAAQAVPGWAPVRPRYDKGDSPFTLSRLRQLEDMTV